MVETNKSIAVKGHTYGNCIVHDDQPFLVRRILKETLYSPEDGLIIIRDGPRWVQVASNVRREPPPISDQGILEVLLLSLRVSLVVPQVELDPLMRARLYPSCTRRDTREFFITPPIALLQSL